jgi:hypothetical protein
VLISLAGSVCGDGVRPVGGSSPIRLRNRIERCFAKLKHFRRFATRYDRLAAHFLGFIHLAAAMIWMR